MVELPEEVRLVIAGPGFGECIVASLPGDFFLIVDCCRDGSGVPYPSTILQNLGFEDGRSRLGICITHWHTDHISGISEVIKKFNPEFVSMPVAFSERSFFSFAKFHNEIRETGFVNPTSEIVTVLDLIMIGGIPYRWLANDRLIVKDPEGRYDIFSLSPVDEAVSHFLQGISSLVPQDTSPPRSLPALSENECSSAIMISFPETAMVFGADLLESERIGWTKVMNASQSLRRKVVFFKIPHHGSSNAYSEKFIATHLDKDSVSVVTPYNKGANPPPSVVDLERISGYPGTQYITSEISVRRVNAGREFGADTENFLRKFGIALFTSDQRPGEVHVKCSWPELNLAVSLHGGAHRLGSQ